MTFTPVFERVFRPPFWQSAAAAAPGNGLLNSLLAYWPSNEAGGANDLLDLHSGGYTLTQVGSPSSGTGKVYAGARQFDASSDRFSRTSEAALQFGDTDFTVSAWVNLANVTNEQSIISKYLTTGNQREWLLEVINGIFRFYVSNDGTATNALSTTDTVSIGTWAMLTAWHDSVGNNIYAVVNNGTPVSKAHSTGIYSGTGKLQVSGINDTTPITITGTGALAGPFMIWNRVLSAADRTSVFNAGAGLPYASYTT